MNHYLIDNKTVKCVRCECACVYVCVCVCGMRYNLWHFERLEMMMVFFCFCVGWFLIYYYYYLFIIIICFYTIDFKTNSGSEM